MACPVNQKQGKAKAVVDGLLYDTETAEFLGAIDNGREFGWKRQDFYRTKKGSYFYVYFWFGCSGNQTIHPISESLAKKEIGQDVNLYTRVFGEVESA